MVLALCGCSCAQLRDVTPHVHAALLHGHAELPVSAGGLGEGSGSGSGGGGGGGGHPLRLLVCGTPKGGRCSRLLSVTGEGAALPLTSLVLSAPESMELTHQVLAHYAGFHAHVAALEEAHARAAVEREEEVARELAALIALLERPSC